jgi:hypothetical protein
MNVNKKWKVVKKALDITRLLLNAKNARSTV